MRTRSVVVTVALTGFLGAAGVASAGWLVTGYAPSEVQAAAPTLEVQAEPVSGAYPGGTSPTQLHVRNFNPFPVEFGQVDFDLVTVDENHPGCPADVLSVEWADPHRSLPPGGMENFEVGVRMSPTAPQACTGATFHVVWRATGTVGAP